MAYSDSTFKKLSNATQISVILFLSYCPWCPSQVGERITPDIFTKKLSLLYQHNQTKKFYCSWYIREKFNIKFRSTMLGKLLNFNSAKSSKYRPFSSLKRLISSVSSQIVRIFTCLSSSWLIRNVPDLRVSWSWVATAALFLFILILCCLFSCCAYPVINVMTNYSLTLMLQKNDKTNVRGTF